MLNDAIAKSNEALAKGILRDYAALSEHLARRGIDVEKIKAKVSAYGVAIPTWGVGTGGTRFARFPGPGEPRNIFDKLDDCGVIHALTRATPSVSLHIPWDKAPAADLKAKADQLGLTFDAMNSNTFQDQPGQPRSYKFGSLSHTDSATRQQADPPAVQEEHRQDRTELNRDLVALHRVARFPGAREIEDAAR